MPPANGKHEYSARMKQGLIFNAIGTPGTCQTSPDRFIPGLEPLEGSQKLLSVPGNVQRQVCERNTGKQPRIQKNVKK